MVFLVKTITIPLWSKFYHRSGLLSMILDSPLRVDFAHFEGWYILVVSVHVNSLPGEDLLQLLTMPLWQVCGLEAQHRKEVFPSICSTRSQWLQPPIGLAPLQGSTRKPGARVNSGYCSTHRRRHQLRLVLLPQWPSSWTGQRGAKRSTEWKLSQVQCTV